MMKIIKTIRIEEARVFNGRGKYWISSFLFALMLALPFNAFADARTDARRYFKRGMQAIRSGAYVEGAELLLKAYKIKPHPNVLYNVAKAYASVGDLDGAIEYFEKYLQAKPGESKKINRVLQNLKAGQRVRRLVERGNQAINEGRYEEGVNLLQSAYNVRPRASLLLRLARAQTMAHRLEEARENYQAYLASRPDEKKKIAREIAQLEELSREIAEGKTIPKQRPNTKSVDPKQLAEMVVQMLRGQASGSAKGADILVGGSNQLVVSSTMAAQQLEDKEGSVFEEVVVTASRRAQSPLDAPNAVTIITEEDIRLSGARSIPDLMRRVPGMDVMAMSYADWNVAARGFNRRIANKLLILVDGRTAYEDFL